MGRTRRTISRTSVAWRPLNRVSGELRLLGAGTGQVVWSIPRYERFGDSGRITAIAWSPDGAVLAVAEDTGVGSTSFGHVRLYDGATGARRRRISDTASRRRTHPVVGLVARRTSHGDRRQQTRNPHSRPVHGRRGSGPSEPSRRPSRMRRSASSNGQPTTILRSSCPTATNMTTPRGRSGCSNFPPVPPSTSSERSLCDASPSIPTAAGLPSAAHVSSTTADAPSRELRASTSSGRGIPPGPG